jgi:hypothetical protein
MPKHVWSTSVKTDAGSGPTDSITLFASHEQNIGANVLGAAGLQVGIADVEQVDMAVTVTNIVSFFLKATEDCRLRINSEVVPVQEFQLTANKAFAWNNASIPQPSANPLTVNITKLFFFNKGAKVMTVIGGFLTAQDVVFS